jgi:RecB family endonuclease NucS
MAKLLIKTELKSVVVVGEFCDWNLDNAIQADLKKGNKTIVVDNFPQGEYKVLSCKNYQEGCEVFPSDRHEKLENRYFNGEENETIYCYF